jgi:hypothetical protein
MEVKIILPPDVHQSLLSQVPEGSPVYRALQKAVEVPSYIRRGTARHYDLDCDEQVARSLLTFARQHCPEAAKEIEFALRIALGYRRQGH